MTVVIAAGAPLWVTPEAARAGAPGFTGTSYAAYRQGVAGLLAEGTSMAGRLDSVALAGEPVRVLDTVDAGIVQVELPAQPNGETGYIGYLDAGHVGADAGDRAANVATAQGERTLGTTPLDAAAVLEIAQEFLGVPYLWGGVEGAGIDCSGLIHIAARIAGRTVPRDAHHQWAATRIDAGWDDLVPGDILYFGERASLDGIDHVGFYAGEGRMLHAPEEGRHVTLEPLSDRARERSVGFGRLAAS